MLFQVLKYDGEDWITFIPFHNAFQHDVDNLIKN